MTLNIAHQLDDIEAAIEAEIKPDAPFLAARPTRPKSKLRPRLLKPVQVAAPRDDASVEPIKEPVAQKAAKPVEMPKIVLWDPLEESPSKLGALTSVVSQIKGRFQKDEAAEHSDKPSVLAKAKEGWGKPANALVEKSPEVPVAQMAKGGSFLSRFNTPVMGVVAGVAVSGFGFVVASVVIA